MGIENTSSSGDVTGNETPDEIKNDNRDAGGDSSATGAGIVEMLAEGFDPSIHAVDAAGNPVLTASGAFRRKPGRKKGGAANVTPQSAPTASGKTYAQKSALEREAQKIAAQQLARSILNTMVGTLKVTIGDEWEFQSKEEAEGMLAATAAYLEAKGDAKLSPEIMLALVAAGYALPRVAHENTRSKLGKFLGWFGSSVKSAFKAVFGR